MILLIFETVISGIYKIRFLNETSQQDFIKFLNKLDVKNKKINGKCTL